MRILAIVFMMVLSVSLISTSAQSECLGDLETLNEIDLWEELNIQYSENEFDSIYSGIFYCFNRSFTEYFSRYKTIFRAMKKIEQDEGLLKGSLLLLNYEGAWGNLKYDFVSFLIAEGADVNAQSSRSDESLLEIVFGTEFFDFYIRKGADINGYGRLGRLSVPVLEEGDTAAMGYLIARGYNVSTWTGNSPSTLSHMIRQGDFHKDNKIEMTRLMLRSNTITLEAVLDAIDYAIVEPVSPLEGSVIEVIRATLFRAETINYEKTDEYHRLEIIDLLANKAITLARNQGYSRSELKQLRKKMKHALSTPGIW